MSALAVLDRLHVSQDNRGDEMGAWPCECSHRYRGTPAWLVTDNALSVHQHVCFCDFFFFFLTEKSGKLENLSYCVMTRWKVNSNKDQRPFESWQVHLIFKDKRTGVQQEVPDGQRQAQHESPHHPLSSPTLLGLHAGNGNILRITM